MAEVGKAWVPVEADTSKIPGQVGAAFDKAGPQVEAAGAAHGNRFWGAFGKVGAALAGAKIVSEVGGFMKDSVFAASDYGEAINKTNVLLGDAGPAAIKWAETNSTAMGQTKQDALDAVGTFGLFGGSAGLAGDDLVGFSTELTTLSADLASLNNTSNETAITAIGAALRGESEPIRQFGVLLDDATLKNRALSMGLIATTTEALTPQQRVLAAHAEIMAQTTKAQGDFARTSDSLPNRLKILSAQWDNMKLSIGERLVPVMFTLLDAFYAVAGWVGEHEQDFRDFGNMILNTFTPPFETLQTVFETATPLVISFFGALKADELLAIGVAVGIMTTGWAAYTVVMQGVTLATHGLKIAQALLNGTMAVNPVMLIVIAIAALAAGLVYAYQKVDWFRAAVDSVGRFLRDDFLPIVKAVWEGISWAVTTYVGIAVTVIGGIITAVQAVWNFMGDFAGGVSGIWDTISGGISGAVESIKGFVNGLVDFFGNLGQRIKDAVGDLGSKLVAAGQALVDGFKRGVENVWGRITNWFMDKIGDLIQAAKDKLWVFSPSRVFMGIGENVGEGFKIGLSSGFDGIEAQIDRELGGMKRRFEAVNFDVDPTFTATGNAGGIRIETVNVSGRPFLEEMVELETRYGVLT